jgi:hypothetical protein
MTSGLTSADALTLHAQDRDHHGGSAPDSREIIHSRDVVHIRLCSFIARDKGKVKVKFHSPGAARYTGNNSTQMTCLSAFSDDSDDLPNPSVYFLLPKGEMSKRPFPLKANHRGSGTSRCPDSVNGISLVGKISMKRSLSISSEIYDLNVFECIV